MTTQPLQGSRVTSPSFIVFLLLVLATVTWRPKVYYSGGADSVVVAKAALTLLALTIAWVLRRRCDSPRPVSGRTAWFLLTYVAASTFGGWAAGQIETSAVLSVRLLAVASTVVLLLGTYRPRDLVSALLNAMLVVGLVGAATGVPDVLAGARLSGSLLPLNPNEIALLCGVPSLGIFYLIFQRRAGLRHGLILVLLLAILWATGSRTGLLAFLIGVAVMLVQARKINIWFSVVAVCSLPCLLYVLVRTSLLSDFFARGGIQNLATLNARTIAWSAALNFADTGWTRWFGSGLVQKQIPVEGQYWNIQGLDSSWVSALVQAGIVGLLTLALWVVISLVSHGKCQAEQRMLFLGLAFYLVVRSTLESGLLDSTPAFTLFILLSFLSDSLSRDYQLTPSWRVPVVRPDKAAASSGIG